MAIREIITGEDHPILRGENEEVKVFDKELQKLISDMTETVKEIKGAGLAAPQVSVSKKVAIMRVGASFVPIINPEIVWEADEEIIMEEGCLSLPKVWVQLSRPVEVLLRYFDENGKEQERKFGDVEAREAQHEVDHLNGVLIVDY